MPIRRRTFLAATAALAGIRLVPQAFATTPSTRERLIAFVDIDRPASHQGFDRMQRAIAARGLPERFGAAMRFVAVDQTDAAQLAALPATLRTLAPAAVIATSIPTARVVKESGIPAVFFARWDPIATGLVASLQRPGGTMTGYAAMPPAIEKTLEMVNDAFPHARNVGIVVDSAFFRLVPNDASARAAAAEMKLRFDYVVADNLEQFEAVSPAALKRFDALLVTYGVVPFLHSEKVVARINGLAIPALYGSSRNVRDGGLAGFEADVTDAADSFARQLEAIFRGVSPGEIAVERPRIYRLSVNLATAKKTGLQIGASFIKRADAVIT